MEPFVPAPVRRLYPSAPLLAFALLGLGCNSILGIKKAQESSCNISIAEDFIEGCIFRMACDPSPVGYGLSACLTYKTQGLLPKERATLNADSCKPVEEALGRRFEDPATCGDQEGWTCNGNVALYCGPDADPFSVDCETVGASCTVATDSGPNVHPCGIPEATNCGTTQTSLTVCEGDLQIGCLQGVPVGFDCAALETSCIETENAGAFCMSSGAKCDTEKALTCTGDDIRLCPNTGISRVFECPKGSECDDSDSATIDCKVPGCESEEPCEESCSGSRIRFCVAGVSFERNCKDYGFDRCEESTYRAAADNEVTAARCAMDNGKPAPGTTADWGEPAPGSGGSSGTGGGSGSDGGSGSGGAPSTDGGSGSGGAPSEPVCGYIPYPPAGCYYVDACEGPDECHFRIEGSYLLPFPCDNPDQAVTLLTNYCAGVSGAGT
jgi:hypothetical protein